MRYLLMLMVLGGCAQLPPEEAAARRDAFNRNWAANNPTTQQNPYYVNPSDVQGSQRTTCQRMSGNDFECNTRSGNMRQTTVCTDMGFGTVQCNTR